MTCVNKPVMNLDRPGFPGLSGTVKMEEIKGL